MFFSKIKTVYEPPKPCTSPLLTADATTFLKEKNSINKRWIENLSKLLNRFSSVDTAILHQIPQKTNMDSLGCPKLWMRSRKPTVREVLVSLWDGWNSCRNLQVCKSKPSTIFSPAFGRKKYMHKDFRAATVVSFFNIRDIKLTIAPSRASASCPLLGGFGLMSSLPAWSPAYQRRAHLRHSVTSV